MCAVGFLALDACSILSDRQMRNHVVSAGKTAPAVG